ncbi:aspartic peptidase domain-containing protein [Irpex rosettiformis]|uniref:Aspartic peptidase domain-containing protein n=1 Tax=Irpex rosettiformis TaxID=378272 RepID=A0ACB8UAT0_9APHY|nr:aspartic peptidase domain-containing protein [Irpex rosettiformis]
MQLGFSFTLLLASLILSLSSGVQAAPTRRNAGLVTLPLKRIHQLRDDIRPALQLQQHINRGLKRHARMTRRDAPSEHQLRENIAKRMFIPEAGRPGSRTKRYNRQGVPKPNAVSAVTVNNAKAKGKGGKAGKAAKGAAAGAAAGAAGAAAAGAAAAAGNATANTGAGFSKVALAAQQAGGLTAANNPTTGNSLGLDIEANDVGYIATVQMGTPPRDFKLLMDSGSADLWVGAEQCQDVDTGANCGNHVFLGSQSSSSFVDTNKAFQVTYGSGAVAGDIITDNINVAGLALNKHTFGVATQESDQFANNQTQFDGLMGLAQSTLSEQKTLTPVESLAQQGLIQDAITSYKISRLQDQKNDGEITFGGLDATKFDAQSLVTFANVNTQGFWEGNLAAVTVDGQDAGLQGRTAILDTGTTLIIAPPSDAAAVHSLISGAKSDGQGGFTIPCTTTASVALTFGGQSFAIDTRDLLFSPVDPNNLTGDCISGISSGQVGGATEWLVGDVFLKNAYFSTDVTKNQISLAKLV